MSNFQTNKIGVVNRPQTVSEKVKIVLMAVKKLDLEEVRKLSLADRVDSGDSTGLMKKIYVMNADGSNITRLTTPRGIEHYWQPRWSPVPISDYRKE